MPRLLVLSLYILAYVHVGIDTAIGISGATIAVEEAALHAKLLPTKLSLAQVGTVVETTCTTTPNMSKSRPYFRLEK